MSTATHNFAQTSSYFIPGQHLPKTFTLLSHNNQEHTFMGDYIIPVLNQQTWPLLHLTMHISLRHLAAKFLLNSITISILPSFLPSYETCSINVNPLFHAAIKTIIKTLRHLRLLSPLFSNRKMTTYQHVTIYLSLSVYLCRHMVEFNELYRLR